LCRPTRKTTLVLFSLVLVSYIYSKFVRKSNKLERRFRKETGIKEITTIYRKNKENGLMEQKP
jgi:spermidine/putrescine-binding protein